MNISLHCTKCGKTYQTKSEHAGKRAKCLKCGEVLLIPGAGGVLGDGKRPAKLNPPGKNQGPYRSLQTCPACAKKVLPQSDGTCPVCREPFPGEARGSDRWQAHTRPAPSKRSSTKRPGPLQDIRQAFQEITQGIFAFHTLTLEQSARLGRLVGFAFFALVCLGALICALINSCSAPSSEPKEEAAPKTPAGSSQPDGGNHGQNTLGSQSSQGGTDLAAPNPSSWVEFTDAGGRFQCRIPPTCRPEQEESAVRSSVDFIIGDAEIGVIVRTTDAPPIHRTQEISDQLRRKTTALGCTTKIRSERLTKVDGHPAADIIASVRKGVATTEMRGVQIIANGWHHAITLTSPRGSFEESRAMFDRFLESYRVGPFKDEGTPILDRELPPELDYDIDK